MQARDGAAGHKLIMMETMQVKRQWSNFFKVLKEKEINLEFYTKQTVFQNKSEIRL